MPSTRNFSIPVLFTAFLVISYYYVFYYPTQHTQENSSLPSMVSHDSDILSDLHVSLRQTAKSPPAIAIKVTNNSTKTLTILTWESPLDELALQLGLLALRTEAGPLDVPTVKVSRKLPPGEDSLVTLAPGESRENEVVLRAPVVPPELMRGRRTRVGLRGRWSRVWLRPRGELTAAQIADLGVDGTAVSGEVEVEGIDIETE